MFNNLHITPILNLPDEEKKETTNTVYDNLKNIHVYTF